MARESTGKGPGAPAAGGKKCSSPQPAAHLRAWSRARAKSLAATRLRTFLLRLVPLAVSALSSA
eukprot:2828014-Lingulodinium_polyedra.AAC.1